MFQNWLSRGPEDGPQTSSDKILVCEDVICDEGARLRGEKVWDQLLKGEVQTFLLPTFRQDTLKL